MFQQILFFIASSLFTLSLWYLIRVTLIYKKFDNQFLFTIFSLFGSGYMIGQLYLSEAILDVDILFYHRLKMVCIYIVVPTWVLTMHKLYNIRSSAAKIYMIVSFLVILTTPFDIFLHLPTRTLEQEFLGIDFRYGFATKGPTYSVWSVATMIIFIYSLVKIVSKDFNLSDKIAGSSIFTICIIAALNDLLNSYGTISSIMVIEYLILVIILYVVAYFLIDEYKNKEELRSLSDQLLEQKLKAEKQLEITEVYTKPSIVYQIKNDKDPRTISPIKLNQAVLFSDLRSFTSFSEGKDPDYLVDVLNDYFNRMNSSVIGYGGEIDKLLGDGLLAIFNNPDSAIKAAIAIKENMGIFNKVNGLDLNNGIGIGFGEIVFGNIGSESKMDYTVIGDTVNSANRLENLTKYYHSDIIISGTLRKELKEQYKIRKLDDVILKGKHESMEIFEILDYLSPEVTNQFLSYDYELLNAFQKYKAREFSSALEIYQRLKQNNKYFDGLIEEMINRCNLLLGLNAEHPIIDNWDGSWHLDYLADTKFRNG